MQSLAMARAKVETESDKRSSKRVKSWLAKAATLRPHAFFFYLADTSVRVSTVKLFLVPVQYVNQQRRQAWRCFWSNKKSTRQTRNKEGSTNVNTQVLSLCSFTIFVFLFGSM